MKMLKVLAATSHNLAPDPTREARAVVGATLPESPGS